MKLKNDFKKALELFIFALAMIPVMDVNAMGISSKEQFFSNINLNTDIVNFSENQYWIIGTDQEGVNPIENNITLFQKNDSTLKKSFGQNNKYSSSFLKDELFNLYNKVNIEEKKFITPRQLDPTVDGYSDTVMNDQYFWALSFDEMLKVTGTARTYVDKYWTRTSLNNDRVYVINPGGDVNYGTRNISDRMVRPAFNLDLSSLYFASSANSENDKLSLESKKLNNVTTLDDNIKLTFKDDSLNLKIDSVIDKFQTKQTPLQVSYSNATYGENIYLSAILRDENNDIKYYGKIDLVSESGTGQISIPFDNVDYGSYQLEIFVEKINGDTISDFSSEPYVTDITVTNEIMISSDIENGKVETSQNGANSGEKISLNVLADKGYQLDTLKIVDADNNEIVIDNNTFIMPNTYVTIYATFKPVEYQFTSGENAIYQGTDLVFTLDGEYDLVDKVLLNDKELDQNHYIITEGSTIITLKDEYLKTLDVGDYELTLTYTNGSSDTTTFTIDDDNQNVVTDDTIDNPKTFDGILFYVVLGLVSIIGLAGAGIYFKKYAYIKTR